MQVAEKVAADRPSDDQRLVAALRRGDEAAFAELIDTYTPALIGVAMRYVGSRAEAEDVVQETWVTLLRKIDTFEERSSLKTWLFGILVNVARSRSRRERRSVPFSCAAPRAEEAEPEAAVTPERFFQTPGHRWQGHWSAPPSSWDTVPGHRLLGRELLATVRAAIDALPERQQQVIVLRDIQGWSAEDVREALDLSEGNQRVLLHRARSKVRRAIERELDGPGG